MNNYVFLIWCEDGGYGWGETGQTGLCGAEGENLEEAKKDLKNQIPGGYKYQYLTQVGKPFGLTWNLGANLSDIFPKSKSRED